MANRHLTLAYGATQLACYEETTQQRHWQAQFAETTTVYTKTYIIFTFIKLVGKGSKLAQLLLLANRLQKLPRTTVALGWPFLSLQKVRAVRVQRGRIRVQSANRCPGPCPCPRAGQLSCARQQSPLAVGKAHMAGSVHVALHGLSKQPPLPKSAESLIRCRIRVSRPRLAVGYLCAKDHPNPFGESSRT